MAQRSNRRFLNPISVEVFRDRLTNRKESGRNPSWPGVLDSTKGRIHWRRPNRHLDFPLAILRRTIHPDKPVVTYCHSGMQATQAYFTLKHLGYDVRLYDGSMSEWTTKGAPVEK